MINMMMIMMMMIIMIMMMMMMGMIEKSKGYSQHVVELLLLNTVQIVPTPLHPMGARYLAGRPSGRAGWLALLLLKAGVVETNPGPKHTRTQVWIYDTCHSEINRKHIFFKCN